MSTQLHVSNAKGVARSVPLKEICAIGRTPDNDLVLEEGRVSRHHAMIRLMSGFEYFVVDLGSSNGTFLNGRPVTVPAALKCGDQIQIGGYTIRFECPQDQLKPATFDTSTRTSLDFVIETIAILVVDIRNFTTLSESLPAGDLSKLVGGWFRDVGRVIERHDGTIDKFIGDAAMAYWLRPRDAADNRFVHGPLQAALDLVELARKYHAQVSQKDTNLGFAIGCGVHVGEATLGNVGEVARRDFTAMGDCVNVAFRIESLCKELGRPIVVSGEVAEAAGAAFVVDDLGLREVKGKTEPIRVSALRTP